MIEEPYRWVEAIANRREYVETQLAGGSPVVALGCAEGVLFVTVGASRQKIFEIYDRIAMGAVGHPGDIERLRMSAIELASTEGFTRSAADVSLRRLAYYSLSPALKAAFEQVYGAPYLARMLFVEVGATEEQDLFLRIDYDGAIDGDRAATGESRHRFGTLSGSPLSDEAMRKQLGENSATLDLKAAMKLALQAWAAGDLASIGNEPEQSRTREALDTHLESRFRSAAIEAALLERNAKTSISFRPIASDDARAMIS